MSELPDKPIETRSAYYVNISVMLAVLAPSEADAIAFSKNYLMDTAFKSVSNCTLFATEYRNGSTFIERITPPASPESQKRYNDWYEANRHLDPRPPVPLGIWDEPK